MDDYVERILDRERVRNTKLRGMQQQQEDGGAWQDFLARQRQELREVVPDSWEEELQDLKRLNQQQLPQTKA
jgi:hypothetical protein